MIRHGHIPANGWHWWWLDQDTVAVHTGRHDLWLVPAGQMPALIGPGYADYETTTPAPPEDQDDDTQER